MDTTTFVIYDNIDVSRYENDLSLTLERIPYERGLDFTPIHNALSNRDLKIRLHEQYHYWQGLRLPFLYAYANECFRQGMKMFADLSTIRTDWLSWPSMKLTLPLFGRLDRKYSLTFDTERLFRLERAKHFDLEQNCTISVKELLECAASIFDWQKYCQDHHQAPNDPLLFERWRKRTPAYLSVFDFLVSKFGNHSMVSNFILPLVNAAFATSVPERAFCELLNRLISESEGQLYYWSEGIDLEQAFKIRGTLQSWLRNLDYDLAFPMHPENVDLSSDFFCFLEPEVFLGQRFGNERASIGHPVLAVASQEWQDLAARYPDFDAYLDFPTTIAESSANEYANSQHPNVRIATMFLPDGSVQSYPLGNFETRGSFGGSNAPDLNDSEARGVMLDIIVVLSTIKGVVEPDLASSIRRCHHLDCQYFSANFCSSYPLVPKDFRTCMFPEKLSRMVSSLAGK